MKTFHGVFPPHFYEWNNLTKILLLHHRLLHRYFLTLDIDKNPDSFMSAYFLHYNIVAIIHKVFW